MPGSVVIRVDPERREWWKATLSDLLPDFEVYLWDEDSFDKASIDYAVVWMPPLGALASLPNLRCVFSVGAGVAHILRDSTYPQHVPIVRTVSEDLRRRMCEYVALHVLRVHRRLPEIESADRRSEWVQYVEPLARDYPVGLLGLGNLGAAVARTLSVIGYPVNGWSRRGRPVENVDVYTGDDGLRELLANSQVVVSLLPGTPATENLLDSEALSRMPEGSHLINVGRGETIVDEDLLAHLSSGHIASATLDVFRSEPLPTDHQFWSTESVLVTSHTASAIEPATGGRVIADNIAAFDRGDSLPDTVDLAQGY